MTDTLAERPSLEADFVRAWPPADWRDVHVVLGVSGGADSVAMLRAAMAIKDRAGGAGRLFVAHLNHGLRGRDAAADEAWLGDLCRRLGVTLETGRADVQALATEQGDGREAAARSARYAFLTQTAERLGARWVAVAHTADDQVETVLHRLIRGTGLAGLAGMPKFRPLSATVSLARPLLETRRAAALKHLADLGQEYRLDATNTDTRFTRNRIRHRLLPLLRGEFSADFDEFVLQLADQAGETQQLVTALTRDLIRQGVIAQQSPSEIRLDCRKLVDQPELLVREVCKTAWTEAGWPLQEMGFAEWQRLAAAVAGEASAAPFTLPGGILATRQAEMLVLRPN